MFRILSKLSTALSAVVFLLSGGAWGQCADGEVAVEFALSTGNWPAEIVWQLNDEDGTNLFTGGAPNSATWCLLQGTYTFVGTDTFGDGWNGAMATFTINGITSSFTVEGSAGQVDIVVNNAISGCTDVAATNYNADATEDDGSCCFGNVMTINLYDSYGDGVDGGATRDGGSRLRRTKAFFFFFARSNL